MAEGPVSDKQLIEALLRERDELYRRATKAEHRLEELSDADAMRRQYEARIRQMQASHQKELSKKENEYQKVLSKKEDEIRSLVARIEYMARKLWGRMSEKRRTPDDPHQLKLDFEGMDLTDDEKRQIEEAARKVTEARKVKVKEHEKQMPVRRKLPENLRRVEEHVYPEGYIGHEEEWILFNDTETSEHLEVTAPDAYVRVTIRHKAMRKSDSRIITAPAKAEPLAKSYAGPTLLTELTIGKFADHLPFYRQIQMYKRLGVELKQPTIEGWFHGIADLMRPMYYSLQDHMLRLDYLQSDESTVPVASRYR